METVRLGVQIGERSFVAGLLLFSIAANRLLRLFPLQEGASLGNHFVIKACSIAIRLCLNIVVSAISELILSHEIGSVNSLVENRAFMNFSFPIY